MIGKTISHYKILEKLGEGGMGVVYKAEDTKLKRKVALKFLPTELTRSDELQERFLREAQAAAALTHPNICIVHEIDETEGQTFIAMEYIDGKSLDEIIESGRSNIDEALDITIQMAEGLARAHGQGIVHRDIKSANILLDKYGQAKILDFGLAKLTEQSRLTRTATIMGTVSYMSPEQARGDETIDHRADIWSLGVVLYEILAGRLPFDAPNDAALLHKIIYEPEPPIRDHKPDLPESLEKAIKKTMQKNPQDRYEDMGALISDLKSIRSGVAPRIEIQEKTIPSIAVLPFADMSPQKDQEYFCDGISESLINALTQLSNLKVIARTSAFSFKGQNLDVREIGKKLNVGTVLEGSIQKAGERVRVTAQLVNTSHGEHLWSEKYDRDMEDIFAIQDEISLSIVDNLKPKLFGEAKQKLIKSQTVDLEAYDLYLRGVYLYRKNSEKALWKAIDYFDQAIEKAPDYALAHAMKAHVYCILPVFAPSSIQARDAFSKARQASLKALEIDENLGEAHSSLAAIVTAYDWDYEGGEKEFKKAIELNPGNAYIFSNYCQHLTMMGRFDEAFEAVQKALDLDPLSLPISLVAGQLFYMAGHHEQAIRQLQKTIEMEPRFPYAHLMLGHVYLQKGMHEEAIAELEKEKDLLGDLHPTAEIAIGMVQAFMGNRQEALQKLELLKETYVPPFMVATLYFALGKNDSGFEWAEKAFEERDVWLRVLKVHPFLDLLDVRSDPRYKDLLRKMGLEKSDATVPMIEQSPSIAVLPFANMSADPEQEYFCDGLAEELINALTQIKDLKVIARTSAFSFRGKDIDIRDIGRKLDVGTILEGSVRKAGNRLRITAQLIDISGGHHIWSERYDRELDDVFAIQDEITLAIVDKLKPRLLGEEKKMFAPRQTIDFEVYSLYLKGRWFLNKQSEEGMQTGIEYFTQVVEKAPDYAPAYAGLADAYIGLPFYAPFAPERVFPLAQEAALKALAIHEELAESHVALAHIKALYQRDWDGAENEFKRAIALNPGHVHAHRLFASTLSLQARFEEALHEIHMALELDPLSLFTNMILAETLFYARHYDESIRASKKVIEMDPSYPLIHAFLGSAYFQKGLYADALAEFEKEKGVLGDTHPIVESLIGSSHAMMGREDEARESLRRLIERSRQDYVPPCLPAYVFLVLGEYDKAFEWFDRAFEKRDPYLCYLKANPIFDDVRSDPRYIALLKKVGLKK
jgi:TolB-like protein/Tfp pilus assembly protein PilF/tRNA A-37 threonylcarbamoyl transferase component Bud32